MIPRIFNRELYKKYVNRFGSNNFIYSISDEITQEIIDSCQKPFSKALLYNPLNICSIKLLGEITKASLLSNNSYDEEDIFLQEYSFNLILTTLSLHLVNDLPGALHKYYNMLSPEGLFIATILGGKTFYQLREACLIADQNLYGGVYPRVMPCIDSSAAPGLLQRAKFNLPIVSCESFTRYYSNIYSLCHELRKMGHSNILFGKHNSLENRKYFLLLGEIYQDKFGTEKGLPLDFEIIILMGSKD